MASRAYEGEIDVAAKVGLAAASAGGCRFVEAGGRPMHLMPEKWAAQYGARLLAHFKEDADLFGDDYFKELRRQYEVRRSQYAKILGVHLTAFLALALSLYDSSNRLSFFSVNIEPRYLKEVLLLVNAILTYYSTLLANDLIMMRGFLVANARRRIEAAKPDLPAGIKEAAEQALMMCEVGRRDSELDGYADWKGLSKTQYDNIRIFFLAAAYITFGLTLVGMMAVIGAIAVYEVWNAPVGEALFPRTVCVLAALSVVFSITVMMPRNVTTITHLLKLARTSKVAEK